MTTAYTSLLGLALPVTGELSGTWGDTVNNSITSLLDSAVAGTTTLSADTTLTTTTGAANQARQAILLCSGHVANITITAPAQSKIYTVINTSATYTVKIRGSGPTAGITIPVSSTATVAWNGSDFVDASNYVNGNKVINGNLTVNGNTTLGDASGDTITINGATTFSNVNPTLTAGTAGGVAYLSNPGKVLTTGSALTFDGTNLGVGTSSPAYKLDVQSSGYPAINIASTAASGANGAGFQAKNGGGAISFLGTETTGGGYSFTGAIANAAYIGSSGANPLQFVTNSVARAQIDSSGNLGLGVTPSGWNAAGYKAMEVGGAGNGIYANNTNDLYLSCNAYFNSSWKYGSSNAASQYEQNAGAHKWFTAPSGTAGNAITFTQAMTLDASGNLLVGGTSNAVGARAILENASGNQLGLRYTSVATYYNSVDSGGNYIWTKDGAERARISSDGTFRVTGAGTAGSTDAVQFSGSAPASALSLDSSGNLLVGQTSSGIQNSNSVSIQTDGNGIRNSHANGTASGNFYELFGYNGSVIGSISQSGTTAVLYNVTSDQRLKENIADAASASELIDSLKVRQYDWKADGNHQRYGFVAQELVQVAPEAVHQPADSEQMMAVDYSKLVPMLVKEIQSLRARVAQLEQGAKA